MAVADGEASHVTHVDERFFGNADCWIEVCRFLSYRSRTRCEVVSTRLATLCASFWQTLRCLDINTLLPSAIVAISAKIGTSLRSFKMRALPIRASLFNTIVLSCPRLHTVDIHVCSDEQLCLYSLRELKELNLIGATGDILELPPMLERFTGLRCVCVDERLRDFFAKHRYLTCFEMTNCHGTCLFDSIAENCPLIRRVACVECDVRLDGVERFANLKELKLSKSSGETFLTDEQIKEIFTRNAGLESLRISGVDRKLGRQVLAGFSMLRQLEELEILCHRSTGVFTDVHLREIIEVVGPTLRRLSLVGGASLSHAVEAIVACSNLRVLVVNFCSYEVSMRALRRIVDGCAVRKQFEIFYANPTMMQVDELEELEKDAPMGVRVRRFESSKFVAQTILNEVLS